MMEKRLAAKGFVVLFWANIGWVRFFSKSAVVHPDDLRKEKLFTWSGSTNAVELYKMAGFHPVPMESTDMVISLRSGLITATPVPPFIALASQMYGPAPNMLDLNWAPLVGAALMAKKTWDQLPAASQATLLAAAKEAGRKMNSDSRQESLDSIAAMQKRGLTVHGVTSSVEEEWREVAKRVYPRIRGSMVPEDIFDEVVRLLDEYRAGAPSGTR
jgi:TRAP-type C4-dicarboxylate transport system substrate-binding protein